MTYFDKVWVGNAVKNLLFFRKIVYTTIKISKRRTVNKMREKECIFCKIASGEIPSATLYEDEDFRVILDLGPASKGHALIIPKDHYRNLYDLDDRLAAKALVLAKKMVNRLKEVLECDGYNIVQNNEEVAGQTVFHFHMHLIPRYKGDGVGLGWKTGELKEADKEEILEKLK